MKPSRLLAMMALTAFGCGDGGLCVNSAQVEIAAPDRQRVAWIFIRGCEGIVADSVQVSILPAGSAPPEDAGNTFVMEKRGGVRVDWTADRALLISHEPAGHVSKQESEVAGVKVTYQVE